MFNVELYWGRSVIAFIFTLIPFLWVAKKDIRGKLYFGTIALFVFLYSGFGSGWEGCPPEYLGKYCIYMLVFGFSCYWAQKGSKPNGNLKKAYAIENLIDKYGKLVIIAYIILLLVNLAANGKITNLLSPPAFSLTDAWNDGSSESGGLVQSLIFYIQQILLPFYLVSLFYYRYSIKKLCLSIIVPIYINYCETGYIARSTLLPMLLIILVGIYKYHPQYRRTLVLTCAIGIPFLAFFLSWFTFARQGTEFNLSFGDAVLALVYGESYYPEHYAEYRKWGFDPSLFSDYLSWLISLPLPGFLKFGGQDYEFNAIFTERISTMIRGVPGFSVLLPGLVGEALFVGGGTLFIIPACITGIVIGKAFKWLQADAELFLLLYIAFEGGVSLARAGTNSIYPFFFKHLIIYLLVVYFLRRIQTKRI